MGLVAIAIAFGLATPAALADPPTPPTAPVHIDAVPLPGTGAITTTIPAAGSSVQLSGGGFTPSEPVVVALGAVTLATVTAEAYGVAATTVTIPTGLTGARALTLSGATSRHTDTIRITVLPSSVPAAGASDARVVVTRHHSPTAVWRRPVAQFGVGALALLVALGLYLVRARRVRAGRPSLWRRWRTVRSQRAWLRWLPRLGLLAGLLVVGAALVWIAVTAMLAQSQLKQVKAEVDQIRVAISQDDLAAAKAGAEQLSHHTARAHQLTSGPVWFLASRLPWLGQPLEAVRGLTSSANVLGGTVLPELVGLSGDIQPSELRIGPGQLNLTKLATAAPILHRAATQLASATRAIWTVPHHTWLSPVNADWQTLTSALNQVDTKISAADSAMQVLPAMLGASTPQRYFVAFLNPAQARGLGGIPGGFAILVADHGTLTFTHFESDTSIFVTPTDLDLGADYDAMYHNDDPTSWYINSVLSPNFPYAAQTWAAMWQQHSGEHVDGAIALDPTALSFFLGVTGPAALPDGTLVTTHDVVGLSESGVYAKFPRYGADQAARKKYLLEIALAAADKLLDSTKFVPLAREAEYAASRQHLMLWSSDASVEKVLAGYPVGDVVPDNAAPYSSFVINSAAGGKLDYYLKHTDTTASSSCAPNGTETASITLTNDAPSSGLSPYVTDRIDVHPYPTQVGDNREHVTYYATAGSSLVSATVDGQAALATPGLERGHPTYLLDIEIPVGRTVVATIVTTCH